METKVCKKCSIVAPLSEFWITDKARGYRRATCKACDRAIAREYYRNTPNHAYRVKKAAREREKKYPRTPEQTRRYNMKCSYGITAEQYEKMVQAQADRCALCGTTEHGRARHGFHWMIDHCHTTGRVRGLLCHACNVRLGAYELLKSDKIGLAKVEAYLKGP